MLSYLFTARYADGSAYSQNPEDTSLREPGRSGFYDVLNGVGCPPFEEIASFSLSGEGRPSYSVDLGTGLFYKDGEQLPPAHLEHEPVTPRRLIYVRNVRQHRVTPAVFLNPQRSATGADGALVVTNSAGEDIRFPEVAQIAQETDRDPETGEDVKVFKVWPRGDLTETDYVIGWQANAADGRNVTQAITV